MQKGKITLLSLMVFCILVLAAFMAFKYIANGIDKKQIKKEVYDTIGVYRGSRLTDAKVREVIGQVLNKRSLQPSEIFFEFIGKGRIYYYFKYEVSINYLIFKRNEIVEVEGEMDNYGG
jgi:hypothetical protein